MKLFPTRGTAKLSLLDSEDGFRAVCRDLSRKQQSFSGLKSKQMITFNRRPLVCFFLGNFTARTVVKRRTRCLAIGRRGGGGIVSILLLFDHNYLGICTARAVVKRQRLLCLATSALCPGQRWPFRLLSAPPWFLFGLYLMISLVIHCFWSSNFNGSSWFIVSLINDRV